MGKLKRFAFGLGTALAAKIKWSKILGTNLSFNLFNVVAPVNGAVFGSSGLLNVLLADALLFILKPKLSLLKILLFLPMLFATWAYARFFRQDKGPVLLAPLFMLAFWLNPTGRKAWPYALLWLLIALPLLSDNLFFRALSVQFIDHAMGSLIFLYLADIPASIWLSAIPLAIFERLLMAAGLSFVTVLALKVLRPEELANTSTSEA